MGSHQQMGCTGVFRDDTGRNRLEQGNDLLECKVGYRAKYILDAISQVAHGTLSLDDLEKSRKL